MKSTSPKALYDLMQSSSNVVIVDVRNPDEYEKLRIKNAILQPLPDFSPEKTMAYLSAQGLGSHDIYVTCASGKRAEAACQLFNQEEYPVTLIEGGTMAWYEAGLPVEGSMVEAASV